MPAEVPEFRDFDRPAPDFALPDTQGRVWDRQELRGPKGLLVMFICNHCPYVKAVAGKLGDEARALGALGIGVAAICSNDAASHPEDGIEGMRAFARQHGFPFPYLHDADQSAARAFDAVSTPDFFGYNAALGLHYRGRLDDAGRAAKPGAARELYAAMRQIAETGRGPARQVPAVGCSIKWKPA